MKFLTKGTNTLEATVYSISIYGLPNNKMKNEDTKTQYRQHTKMNVQTFYSFSWGKISLVRGTVTELSVYP